MRLPRPSVGSLVLAIGLAWLAPAWAQQTPSAPDEPATEQAQEELDGDLDGAAGEGVDIGPPPPPPPPDGILPLIELTRLAFSPRDRPKPLLYGPRLLVVGESGFVEGHDASTGEFAWKLGLPGEVLHDPVIFDAAPLEEGAPPEFNVVISSPSGRVLVVDGPTGAIERETQLPFELALPPTRGPGSLIFLATPTGDVLGYDVEAEEVVFQTATEERPLALSSSESTLVVSGGSQKLTVLDLPGGTVRWSFTGRDAFHARATFDEERGRLYIGDATGELYCLSLANGDVKFRWSTGASIRSAALLEDERVYVATWANTLFAFHAGNGSEQWRANLPGRPATGPKRVRNRLLVPTLDGIVVEVSPQRGQIGKRYTTPGEILHPPTFYLATPSEDELLATEEDAPEDELDREPETPVVLDPSVFGPEEIQPDVVVEEDQEDEGELAEVEASEPVDPSGGDWIPIGADPAMLEEPREPAWFERSRIAIALRTGEVVILQHGTEAPPADETGPEDGEGPPLDGDRPPQGGGPRRPPRPSSVLSGSGVSP